MNHPYSQHVKPRLAKVLAALGLDHSYERAEGDHLYWRDAEGREHAVLDLLGGYGSLLFGHNHPQLVATARELLEARVAVHAQFSLRRRAGDLAQRLDAIAARETGGQWHFKSVFANSGAEAIEAAIKHAELERVLKLQALLDDITLHIEEVRAALRRGEAELPADLYELAEIREKSFDVRNFDDLIVGLVDHNAKQLVRRPVFLALEKSFHGKLAGSVQLTYNKLFRRPFQYLGLKTRFVPMGDAARLERIAADEKLELYDLGLEDGRVVLRRRELPIFTAFLVEPIQGEGGVHELQPDFARAIRRFCNQHDIPLVVDEIQSGMGRSGSFFASSQIGLKGDYYALSKSLGGGLAKIAALLIREDRYRPDFGLLHSSTYAEDDFSAGIALKVLELLEADDGAAYRRAAALGEQLRARLLALAARHPGVIREVRGRGLFLGIELAPQDGATSQIIRGADAADSLGYLVSGYLLRTAGLRVAPTGSAPRVLRLEPSLLIGPPEIERLETALERLCLLLERQDALHIVFPLADSGRPWPREDIRDFRDAHGPMPPAPAAVPTRPVRKVAFVNHLIGPEWLRQVDPSLAELSDAELRAFVLKMAAAKKSAPYPAVRIQSPLGPAVDFILYPLCVVSEQMGQWLAHGDLDEIREDIEERVRAARDDGCEIAGLGMYTSIVSNNCTALKVPEIGLTSGNALTVAMSMEALEHAVAERGLDWPTLTLAVVGAAGNIASTYAAMLAERAQRLLLVGSGRDGSLQRVRSTLFNVYEACWQLLQSARDDVAGGIAGRLAQEPLIAQWLAQGAPAQGRGRLIHEALLARHGEDPFIRISQDPCEVREADVVLCAANAPEPFLDAADFRRGAVVCDVAVPHNVREAGLAARPDLRYLQGGIVATPNGESLHPGARAFLGEGQLFACMAETALLGLAGMSGHYSYGAISPRQVREIAALAAAHGFRLADFKRSNSL
jgi:acetylornithine/succinyldiaminopimelate/putrescine aminotransferase/predicted amino acid dehydrogenase